MTVRLYHHDVTRRSFRARVVSHGEWRGRPSLVLDQTGFYPESGGQMADRGTVAAPDGDAAAVVDVQVDGDGVIHHVIDGRPPGPGVEVEGAVDWARRRVHMALHTGQHVLSRALVDEAGAATASARLGETDCTVDVTRDAVPEAELARAEDLANAVVDDDLPVRAWFPSADELAGLPLRREPKVAAEVRVVAVGDFDYSPCGGTHCTGSAQIGSIRILSVERYKGMTRIHFAAGARARAILAGHSALVTGLARELTCAPAELAGAVERLRRALADGRSELSAARDQLAAALAEQLAAGAGPVVASVPDPALLRPLAARLTAAGRDVYLAAATADATQIVVARASGSPLDCGATVRRLIAAAGGRGGGKADHAEARLPAGLDWPAAVAALAS